MILKYSSFINESNIDKNIDDTKLYQILNELNSDRSDKFLFEIEDLLQEYIDKYQMKRSSQVLYQHDQVGPIHSNKYQLTIAPRGYAILTITGKMTEDEVSTFVRRLGRFGYKCKTLRRKEDVYEPPSYTRSKSVYFFVIMIDDRQIDESKYIEFGLKNDVNESLHNDDTLYIFDFDDTLVLNPSFEDLAIQYLKEDVTVKSLLNSSVRKIGISTSDLKWENGKIYVNDPYQHIDVKGNWVRKGKRVYLTSPDKFYFTDMSLPIGTTNLVEFYNSVDNKAIVTGRSNEIRHKIKDSLHKFDLDEPNHGLFCYPTKSTTNGDRVAAWKARTIVDIIKKSGFKNVHFYDDNSKWVNKVTATVKKELPDVNWTGVKYKHKNG